MKENKYNFWQDHFAHYLIMAFSYDRREYITNPDCYGKRTGDCGDTIEIFLTMRND
jgi:nitrogen fixation NifU-like protein